MLHWEYLQFKRHIESVHEGNKYSNCNICYTKKDTLNPFMKKRNVPNTKFVCCSLKDILHPFIKEINIPNAKFVAYSLKDIEPMNFAFGIFTSFMNGFNMSFKL